MIEMKLSNYFRTTKINESVGDFYTQVLYRGDIGGLCKVLVRKGFSFYVTSADIDIHTVTLFNGSKSKIIDFILNSSYDLLNPNNQDDDFEYLPFESKDEIIIDRLTKMSFDMNCL